MVTKFGNRKLVLAGFAAVLVVVAGVVGFSLGRGDDGNGADPDPTTSALPDGALAERWHTDKLPKWGEDGSVSRMWAVDDTVVAVTTSGVWGFDAGSGEQRWELEAPDDTIMPCAASATVTQDGAAAVLYGEPADRCGERLVVFDTGGGEVLWHKELTDYGDALDPPRLSIGDKVVTVGFDNGGYYGRKDYRFSRDGDKLPLLETPGSEACPEETRRVQGQTHTLVESVCDAQLVVFDTQSGKRRWSRSTGGTSIPGTVVTDSPLTVSAAVGGGKRLETYSDKGKPLADIKLPDRVRDRPHVVDDSVLIIQVGDGDGSFVAVDLKDGDEVWRDTGLDYGIAVGADDDRLLVLAPFDPGTKRYVPEGYDCRLVSLNPSDGRQADEGILPCAGAVAPKNALAHDALVTDKALYLIADDESAPRLTAYERPG